MPRLTLRHPAVLLSIFLVFTYLIWTRNDKDSVISSSASTAYRELQEHLRFPQTPSKRLLTPPQAYKERDGLLYLSERARPGANEYEAARHPILYLIEKAKREWKAKVEGQSQDVREASLTYRRKYGRPPPRGFDKWFEFARENSVILLDDYDQITRDMLPFLGLPGEVIRQRSEAMMSDPSNYYYQGSFTLWIKDGRLAKVTGGMADHPRAEEQAGLIKRFVQYLPDMNVTVWAHDTPVMHLTGEKRQELQGLALQGKVLAKERWDDWGDPAEFVGWEAFCLPDSNLRNAISGVHHSSVPDPSFIYDHYAATDYCLHPGNLPLHSLTGNYGVGPRAVNLSPLFSQSKMTLYADILVTPLEQWGQDIGKDIPWDQKKHNTVLWRGSSTGSRYDRGTQWKSSQRVRLALLANSKSTSVHKTVYTTSPIDNVTMVEVTPPLANANEALDILFTGAALQCNVDDGTCAAMERLLPFTTEHMSPSQANEWKYVFDVDGNGWSGRFHRLLSSNSAVLKSTGFVEWWNDRIMPWVHYIPVKLDYNDLHSIAAFFTSPAHDGLGREIGLAGKEWAAKHWRYEDMEVYTYRLLLEYARVLGREADDLKGWDYKD